MKLRLAGYCRVSTEDQRGSGYSYDVQQERIAGAHGLKQSAVHWYGAAESAVKRERPEWNRLLGDIPKGKFDAICCFNIDRWARSIVEHKNAVDEMRQHHVRFFELGREWMLEDGRDRRELERRVLAAEHDPQPRLEASKESMAMARALGFSLGAWPYGRTCVNQYDRNRHREGQWAVWEKEPSGLAEKWIRRQFDWYMKAATPGKRGFRIVATKLDALAPNSDYWSKAHRLGEQRGKRKPWGVRPDIDTLANCVRDRLLTAGPVNADNPGSGLLTAEEVGLIRQRAADNRKDGHGKRHVYPLSHVVRCAACNTILDCHRADEKHIYYVHPTRAGAKTERCTRNIRAEEIEQRFFIAFGNLLRGERRLRQAIQDAMNQTGATKAELDEKLETVEDKLRQVAAKAKRVVAMLAKFPEGSPVWESAAKENTTLALQHEVLAEQRGELRAERSRFDLPTDLDQQVLTYWHAAFGKRTDPAVAWPKEAQRRAAHLFFGGYASLRNRPALGLFVRYSGGDYSKNLSWEARGVLGMIDADDAQLNVAARDLPALAEVIVGAGNARDRSCSPEISRRAARRSPRRRGPRRRRRRTSPRYR